VTPIAATAVTRKLTFRKANILQEKLTVQTGDRAPAERTIWKHIQASRELPEKVKKTLTSESFGITHAEQLLRLGHRPEDRLVLAEA